MTNTLSAWTNRAKLAYQTEGIASLFKMVSQYLTSHIYYYHQYYLNKRPIREGLISKRLPRIQNFIVKVITSNKQADELVAEGFEDFRSHTLDAVKFLDKGAIAFCIFVEREFACIHWIGITAEAKRVLLPAPFRAVLSDNEAISERVYTVPKYRRLGLNEYGIDIISEY